MSFRAVLGDIVLAEAEDVVRVEGNAYFPPESVHWEHLIENDATSHCFFKGKANYFDAEVEGRKHESVGWTYDSPSKLAKGIAEHVAFWGNVRIENDG